MSTSLNAFYLFALIILFHSCTKLEAPSPSQATLEQQFFELPANANPILNRVVEKMKAVNSSIPFIEEFVKKQGYLKWEYAEIKIVKPVTYKNQSSNNSVDELNDTIVSIPAILANQNFVNSILNIKINIDAVYKLIEGLNYLSYGFNRDSSRTEPNADDIVREFLKFEKTIYGSTEFLIKDNKLFGNWPLGVVKPTTFLLKSAIVPDPCEPYEIVIQIAPEVYMGTGYWIFPCEGQNQGPQGGGGTDPGEGPTSPGNTGGGIIIYGGWYNFGLSGSWSASFPTGGGGTGSSTDCRGWNRIATNNPQYPDGGPSYPCYTGPVYIPIITTIPNSNVAITSVVTQLQLGPIETYWLNQNPDVAEFLLDRFNENQIAVDADVMVTDPDALIASKIYLQAYKDNLFIGPYNATAFESIFNQYYPGANSNSALMPGLNAYLRVQCFFLRLENPEWSDAKVYWEAIKELVHLSLDIAGLVPFVGEFADLANGTIYLIEGDVLNASISAVGAIPVAGWASTTTRIAKKTLQIVSGAGIVVGKTTLKWYKQVNNKIHFGSRKQLRRVLGIGPTTAWQAHHIIPWELAENQLIQKAASGQNPFHLNELLNGIPLGPLQHYGSHPQYTAQVLQKLDELWNLHGGIVMSPNTAEQLVRELADEIRAWILSHPYTPINNMVL